MIDSDKELNDSPYNGTPYANLDSDARSVLSDLENDKNQIGHGSFGRVYKSEYITKNNERIEVAVKKINIRKSEGFPLSAIREITILKQYNHPNIVKLIDTFVEKPKKNKRGNVSLVYEYAQHDLASLIKEKVDFKLDCIKSIMFQILNGVKYIHDSYILHRDIKPANILITNKGEVKLADFGLSRFYEKRKNKWELLLSECYYKTSVDMWSVGCVMAELFIKSPLFKEQNVISQIKQILCFIGKPSESELQRYFKINEGGNSDFINSILPEDCQCSIFEDNLEKMDKTGFLKKGSLPMDLIKGLLTFNVNKRLTAEQALKHEFFKDIKDLADARFPLSVKLQEDVLKNKEFHNEKIIFVKKKNWVIKEAKNNSIINSHFYCSEIPEKKGHIFRIIDGYNLEEDKMEEEQSNQNEQIQNWNTLDNFI